MKSTKNIALAGIIIALIALMAFVPMIGFINVPPVAITLIHVPVIIGTITMKDYKYALIFGLSFGLFSFIVNSYTPSLTQPLFFNPMVSIVPRLFVGIFTLTAYNIIYNAFKNITVAAIFGAVAGTLTNTILVITSMSVFGQSTFADGFLSAVKYVVTINGSLEIIVAVILVPIIARALIKYREKTGGA